MEDTPLYTHQTELDPGDVAIVFKANGDIQIAHNIETVRLTNVIDAKNSGGFMMALACLVTVEDEALFQQKLQEAATRLARYSFPDVPDTMQ